MNVTVRYMAQLRQAAGTAEEALHVPTASTVADLLRGLARRDPLRPMLLTAVGDVQPTLLLFVGDAQADPGHVLRDDDVLTLLTPIAGGSLSPEEQAVYEWQMWVPGFGEEGQRRLKGASVLVSRCGGVGGAAAHQLAAAGVGRLVLAHAGDVRPSDLNRQLLMTHDALGTPRMDIAPRRLRELNPRLVVEAVPENVSEANAARLVGSVDLVVGAAPRFAERLLLNREAVRQGKPLIDCAMYELQGQVTAVLPGRGPCLACLYPEEPPAWSREFPVFGAVAGAVGCLGAMEAIKVLSGLGEPLAGCLLSFDLRAMSFRKLTVRPRPDCPVCGGCPRS